MSSASMSAMYGAWARAIASFLLTCWRRRLPSLNTRTRGSLSERANRSDPSSDPSSIRMSSQFLRVCAKIDFSASSK